MCRGNRKRVVTTMVTYSHASTPLGQSERAYYLLSYFIKAYAAINFMPEAGGPRDRVGT